VKQRVLFLREREVFLSITQGVIEITQGREKVIETAQKSSWNKPGVEPLHQYRPRLTQYWFSGTDPKGPVLFGLIVQIKQKRGKGVENTSRSFWCRGRGRVIEKGENEFLSRE